MAVFFDAVVFFETLYRKSNSLNGTDRISGRIVCFDYGTRKMGVAVSDDYLNFAFPKTVLIGDWRNVEKTISEIAKICEDNHLKFVVFGYPIGNNGLVNENCNRILQIANVLGNNGFEVLLFDERFSTKASVAVFNYEKLRAKNGRHKQKMIVENKYDDAGAASILLQDVLSISNKVRDKK